MNRNANHTGLNNKKCIDLCSWKVQCNSRCQVMLDPTAQWCHQTLHHIHHCSAFCGIVFILRLTSLILRRLNICWVTCIILQVLICSSVSKKSWWDQFKVIGLILSHLSNQGWRTSWGVYELKDLTLDFNPLSPDVLGCITHPSWNSCAHLSVLCLPAQDPLTEQISKALPGPFTHLCSESLGRDVPRAWRTPRTVCALRPLLNCRHSGPVQALKSRRGGGACWEERRAEWRCFPWGAHGTKSSYSRVNLPELQARAFRQMEW